MIIKGWWVCPIREYRDQSARAFGIWTVRSSSIRSQDVRSLRLKEFRLIIHLHCPSIASLFRCDEKVYDCLQVTVACSDKKKGSLSDAKGTRLKRDFIFFLSLVVWQDRVWVTGTGSLLTVKFRGKVLHKFMII